MSFLALHEVDGNCVSAVIDRDPESVESLQGARRHQGQVGVSTIVSGVLDEHPESLEVPGLRSEQGRCPFGEVMSLHTVASVGVCTAV